MRQLDSAAAAHKSQRLWPCAAPTATVMELQFVQNLQNLQPKMLKKPEKGFIGLTRQKISDCSNHKRFHETEKARHKDGPRFAALSG